jgi:solute carrier family 50 protein (sugar transporter)
MLITNCFDLMEFSCPSLQTKALKLLGAMMVSFILVVVIVLEVVHDKHRRKLIIGVFCAVFSVGMYASPLTVMVDPHYHTPSPIPFLPSQ